MAIHPIVTLGDPILREKAKKVHRFDAALQKLAAEMFETMHAANGIGLAAPQIGLGIRLLVIELDDKQTGKQYKVALANPEIVEATGEQVGVDACLSIPGYYAVNVRRAARVMVKGQDPQGKPIRVRAGGLFAWALQHEIDHLDGILYLDRLDRPDDLRVSQSDDPIEAEVPAG
jgi:peptide deformylase